jgi:arsenate reductase-like glutaredoxin family protein
LYEATDNQEIETEVHGLSSEPSRRTEIRQPARQMADDLSAALRERTENVADL